MTQEITISMHNRPDDDSLSRFRDGVVRKGSGLPIPLTATRFHVNLQGHVAAVETWRTFRNGESESIEATLTMPMPVRAVLYHLDATVDGRTLNGICQPREAARQTYEDAIDEGRLAVLHEEVLRGIHQLSLAHLAPGAEVVIRARWAALLVPNGPRRVMLRIPLTVGDVYGRSPLRASDRLSNGGPNGMAPLSISAGDKTVWLGETALQVGEIEVPLNRPIDLSMEAPSRSNSAGRAADGRSIALSIVAEPESDHAITAAILVDRSGSMAERCSADAATTKHGSVVAGLRSVSGLLRSADRIDLFEVNQACQALGKATTAGGFEELLWHLGGPEGGTEISGALQEAIDRSPAMDVLIVTDGKSYAPDAMALARTGRRFSVVLIGEDSLEAGIGHLAALTGGSLVVARGSDVAGAVASAIAALRTKHEEAEMIEGPLDRLIAVRDGLRITAEWRLPVETDLPALEAVAALATTLALPRLPEAQATALSVAEGLAGPLTSLVLVDRDGARQSGLPVTRKIDLPAPAASSPRLTGVALGHSYDGDSMMMMRREPPIPTGLSRMVHRVSHAASQWLERSPISRRPSSPWPQVPADLWDAAGPQLVDGDLSGLPPDMADQVQRLAARATLKRVARILGLSPVVLVLGILARRDATGSRTAERVARRIFAPLNDDVVARTLATLPI